MPSTRSPRTTRSSRTSSGDVREQLLVEATRQFAAHGFDGASLQDIARAVGVRKPSLLYHFASKEELRQGVLEAMLARWNGVLPRVLLAASSGKDRFERVLGEMIGFFAEDTDRARLLLREALDRPEEVRPLLQEHLRKWVDAVAEYIRSGQEEGRIYADVDPEAYVVQVMDLVVAGFATRDSMGALAPEKGRRRASDDRFVRELLRVARTSLFRPRPESGAKG